MRFVKRSWLCSALLAFVYSCVLLLVVFLVLCIFVVGVVLMFICVAL